MVRLIRHATLASLVLAVLELGTAAARVPARDDATAQTLLDQATKELHAKAYEQALADFLGAYARLPAPEILLEVASVLRAMGRLADAANTYERYILDPSTGAERMAEVKDLLDKLDTQLVVLTVRIAPRGSRISIDGGPFVVVGQALSTRVEPGPHVVRVRNREAGKELAVTGVAGQPAELAVELATSPDAGAAAIPDRVEAWLITGTSFGLDPSSDRVRTVHSSADGHEVVASIPGADVSERVVEPLVPIPADERIRWGATTLVRIDGKGRGVAAGAGIVIGRGRLEGELMILVSNQTGGYAGARYRFLEGTWLPYLAAGLPGFLYDEPALDPNARSTTHLAIGTRIAAGIEIALGGHLSVQADVGYEHFFHVGATRFEADELVPTVGVIGRL